MATKIKIPKLNNEELKAVEKSLERQGFNMKVLNLGLDHKIREAMEASRITVEHRGHYGNGRFDLAGRMKDGMRMSKCSLPDAKRLNNALKREGKLRKFVTLGDASCLMACPVCAEHLATETDGKTIRPTTECKYPNGMTIEFELNVPSGKIVCRDDLRPLFDYYGDFNINTTLGTMQATLAMAKIGCAHGYVGNSCPGIYRQADDTYIIANGAYPKDSDYDDEDFIAPEGERVAGICTDLWWYSLVDYDEFKKRAGKDVTPEDAGAEVFEVKPGVYRFHQMREDLNNEEKDGVPYTYAEFKWAREPDPVVDYLEEVRDRNFTIGQVVHRSLSNYPGLYPDSLEGIQSALSHIFCVIGGGGEWHENGFIQYDPGMPADEPETTIPKFDKPGRWYGLHPGYSSICVLAGVKNDYYNPKDVSHMNESFLRVAFDVARNIYLFGAGNTHCNDENQRKYALQCLQGLAKRYPAAVPEDCKVILMPIIDQANWVLKLLEAPVTFYWHTTKGGRKVLWMKNKYHDAQVILSKPSEKIDNEGRREIASPGKFMSYGHAQSREAMYWASLMGQFALWIKGQEHVATDALSAPNISHSGTFIDHRCAHAKVKDGFKERLTRTSYNVKTIRGETK